MLITRDQEEIIYDFVEHFTALLGIMKQATPIDNEVLQQGPLASDNDCREMVKPVINEEIKAAMFDIGKDKAPGPDGYTSAFYKKQWDKIGEEMIQAIKEFSLPSRCLEVSTQL